MTMGVLFPVVGVMLLLITRTYAVLPPDAFCTGQNN
jgi:hypothetical protein